MTNGSLKTLAIFDKPDPLEGPFFEETIYVTPSREPDEVQKAIVSTTASAARALGLWHGPIHAEMRVNPSGVYMLEIAARPIGGLCARVLRFDCCGLEELIVLHAVGRMPADIKAGSSCRRGHDDSGPPGRSISIRFRRFGCARSARDRRYLYHRKARREAGSAARRRQLHRFHFRGR